MSTQCNRFVQNAWKKELCSNCFKPKEEHAAADEILRLNVEKASTNLKIDHLQLQSILRGKTVCRKDQRKKNVGFPDSLTEIIGYGGDDFFSDSEEEHDEFHVDSSASPEDEVPDSEEERALGNQTRANTNFNTVTANLTDPPGSNGSSDAIKSPTTTTPPKSFASLMLGRIQRDADGRKTTLLVSVTPFGGDEAVPTAKRPVDRKINTINLQASPFKCKSSNGGLSDGTADVARKLNGAERRKADEQEQKRPPEQLEKIVDMPLITSANMITVVRKEGSPAGCVNAPAMDAEKAAEMTQRCAQQLGKPDNKRNGVVPRGGGATVKKTEAETSRTQSAPSAVGEKRTSTKKGEARPKREEEGPSVIAATSSRNDEAPESDRPMSVAGKDTAAKVVDAASPRGREVEGRCMEEEKKKFCFESSRELAGEPDGKADEEEMTEPPALPSSPPPIVATEPRPSFLHGGVINVDSKAKPAVPQKPLTFSAKASPVDAPPLTVRKIPNGDYVLPPPSVQNVAGRSAQNFSALEAGLRRSAKKNPPNEAPSSEVVESPSASEIAESESRTKGSSRFALASSSPVSTSSSLSPSKSPMENGEVEEMVAPDEDFAELIPVSISTMELVRSPNKRRMAPRPPAAESAEELLPASSSLFARNPGASLVKSDSPVVREKEKRERSSSCSPKFRKAVCELPDPTSTEGAKTGEPRRTISLSQDSLTSEKEAREEKKRGRSRRGFSLKRFLRMGSRKDMDMVSGQTSGARSTDEIPSTPQPKPRLEIIHPLELDGAAVEVVGNDRVAGRTIGGEDQTDSARGDGPKAGRFPPPSQARPGKPPPPPRNQSLEDWSRLDPASKPVRPPPPRADAKLSVPARTSDKPSSKSAWRPAAAATSDHSIYANLGEVRSALAPSKPQRTASMRDRVISQPVPKRHGAPAESQHQDYDGLVRPTSDSPTSNDSHVYECLSSSPECDSNLELRHGIGGGFRAACKRKSDSSAMENGAEKFHHQPFVRSTSLPYCGSETESELYAPYTFYTGDEGAEEDQDWKSRDDEPRMSRLRQRRGRSIVHRSLEDNYGAVVVANHEALAQFLEQENQTMQLPVGLRALKNANSRLKHFNVDTLTSVSVGRRIFCPATWNDQSVTLCITFDLAVPTPQRDFYLAPIIEFVDTVPKEIVGKVRSSGNEDTEATISVLPRVHVTTVQSFGTLSKDTSNEGASREASFVLLQLVNALKSLQARGIEDTSKFLSDVILCREDKDICYRLYLLQGRLNIGPCDEPGEERASLCECALIALQQLHLTSELPLIRDLLIRERAVTLSQVKSVLEFSLWGPADVPLGGPREREVALQRWLDLERANVLHALVKTKAALTVTDEYQLLFLVRTTAKIMSEASVLLDEQRNRLARRG
ncbi:PREDICTED: serine/arginine repetitive matrix protein 2 isoform X2 [Dinoponera quadriceps]|uniref:Serine/arginine repetitive matrix protein 2 isoform X2 n=1 Tax=Dinoponera quadriceps TaxID=609295 RepID=A0A6P3YA29_DINQU|nr:PREDICTED: serine/arginine repetitive matrix protein 2 isoform X2 [Dinoponera quadriceps]